jgi:FkbM family methyltransferase
VRASVIAATRLTPTFIKKRIQETPWIYHFFRRIFSFFVGLEGNTVAIESGPLQGMILVVDEHVSHAHIRGSYELETQFAIDKMVSPGFICYDLGASIGYLTLLMARKAKMVYAFEPAALASAEILKHAAANHLENITIVPSPVSDVVRTVRFSRNSNAYGSRIAEDQSKWPTVELTTITLDDFVRANPAPDFIKIDVEDEEARVLQGARSILSQRKTTICCELHSEKSARGVQEILFEYNYTLTDLKGRRFEITGPVVPGDVQILASPLTSYFP